MSYDDLQLSASTLAALLEFKQEEVARAEQFEALSRQAQAEYEIINKVTIDDFQEDWQLSQFWYADETAKTLGRALLEGADENTVIVIASAPSVYAAIKSFPAHEIPTDHIYLLEHDKRFELLAGVGKFFYYDYKLPNDIPEFLRNKCHRLLIDPPFLEEDCQIKSAQTAFNLLVKDKHELTKTGDQKFKWISSTGERMQDIIKSTYPDCRVTDFYPQHKNCLGNEFRCYTNFECKYWKFESNEKPEKS